MIGHKGILKIQQGSPSILCCFWWGKKWSVK